VAERAEALDRRGGGRDALGAKHERLPSFRAPEDDRQVAARPVQVRLDDLQREARRGRGVERVAAALEHRHSRSGCEPMRRGDHAEASAELRTRREAVQASSAGASINTGASRPA
jgi:hypothetical protein